MGAQGYLIGTSIVSSSKRGLSEWRWNKLPKSFGQIPGIKAPYHNIFNVFKPSFLTSAEANQRECTSVFPVALHILSDTKDPQVIRLLASFLSLTADNNGNNYQCCVCK